MKIQLEFTMVVILSFKYIISFPALKLSISAGSSGLLKIGPVHYFLKRQWVSFEANVLF